MASAKRELLLRSHRHRLRREDLEDCYSQAVLEIVAHARRGGRFASRLHIANVLEQRFVSRIHDRRRAVSGRSPMQAALEAALSLDCVAVEHLDVVDVRAELEPLVVMRHDLRRLCVLAERLTHEQRLVLVSQLWQIDCREFCSRQGWSREKYRKVAQRARARLRALMACEESGVAPGERTSVGQEQSVGRGAPGVPSGGWASEQQAGTSYEHISPHS